VDWQKDAAVESNFIVPGKSMQNGLVECFNNRMCDELLTEASSSISTTPAPNSRPRSPTST
jgi:hypothetical protein